MELMDVVRHQVGLLSLGSECDRDFSADGWLLANPQDRNFYLNAFYPAHRNFQYPDALVSRLYAYYSDRGIDGFLVRYDQDADAANSRYAGILVPADAHVQPDPGPWDFSCTRTDDVDRWCASYVAGSPHIPLQPFRERTARLQAAREVHFYLFSAGGRTIGGGSLVRLEPRTFLANGYSVMAGYRGDIISRARMVRMATDHDVVALTSSRFARVLKRAMPQVAALGHLTYLALSDEAESASKGAGAPTDAHVPMQPASL